LSICLLIPLLLLAAMSSYLSPSDVLRKGLCCGCGSLSLSSSIIIKKMRPIIKLRADYKIENFL
jgi:hypothetical protein